MNNVSAEMIESDIIKYIVDTGKIRGRPDVIVHLFAYIVVFGPISQQELVSISKKYYFKKNRSGISSGTISKYLNNYFLTNKIVEKIRVQNKPPAYKYRLKFPVNEYITQIQIILQTEVDEINSIIDDIFNNNEKFSSNSVSIEKQKFFQRLNEFKAFLNVLRHKIKNYKHGYETSKTPIINQILKPSFNKKVEIDSIEHAFIDILSTTFLLGLYSEYYSKILGYFITRKTLTQRKLRQLTGFSLGTISEGLNLLLQLNFITIESTGKKGKISYSMNSIEDAFFKKIGQYLSQIDQLHPILLNIQENLNEMEKSVENQEKLHKLREINEMYLESHVLNKIFFKKLKER
ncbi:hypothetical protein [Candidatus Lokiarchaeum ossiferum]|uniref:hypothetical protein n=1 Tax=Candidatus Lokiarchaeum ossiferum TaxID=2951803 RepID=UPI00352EC1DD